MQTFLNQKKKCQDCKSELAIPQKNSVGDLVLCNYCGAEYEVVKVNPLEIKIISEEK